MDITETKEPQIPAEPQGLLILEEAQYFLHQSSKWANFLAILGFIGSVLCGVAGLVMGLVMSAASSFAGPSMPFPPAFGGLFSILYVGGAIVYFLISRHLYRYAGSIKMGVEIQSADQVSKAFESLHSFFKWKGIILIALLALYLLMIIGFVIMAAAGMSMYGGGHHI